MAVNMQKLYIFNILLFLIDVRRMLLSHSRRVSNLAYNVSLDSFFCWPAEFQNKNCCSSLLLEVCINIYVIIVACIAVPHQCQ